MTGFKCSPGRALSQAQFQRALFMDSLAGVLVLVALCLLAS